MRQRKKPYHERILSRKRRIDRRTRLSDIHVSNPVADYHMSIPRNHEARYVDINHKAFPVEDTHPMGRFGTKRLLEAHHRVKKLVKDLVKS